MLIKEILTSLNSLLPPPPFDLTSCSTMQIQTAKSPLVITFRFSRFPAPPLGERIKKWKLEQGIFQKDLAKIKEYPF
jgi:hypothetical protein